ncbi:MAG TPA: MFS transporter [Amycolatopsis sp.]|nr:MFS transporter [Amycolatopsis sp.]
MTTVPARGRFSFAGLAFALGVLILGTNLPSPLYSVYAQRFGFSPLTITLIVSVYVVTLVPALLVCGSLADSAGPRFVLLPALVIAVAGAVVFATAGSTVWLFVARALQGVAVGAASGPLVAALVATEPTGNHGRASFVGSLVTTVGAGAGPVFAGALAQYAPAPLVLSFVVEIVLLLVAFRAVLTLPARARSGTRLHLRRPRIPAGTRGSFAVAAAVSFLSWAVAYIVLALVPSYVESGLRTHNLLLGGASSGMLLLCAALAQVVFGRRRFPAMPAGLVLLIAGLAGIVVAGMLSSIPLLLVTVAVTGIGQGLGFLGALRRVNALAPAETHASVASAFYVVTYLGGGGPVIVVGLLAIPLGLVLAVQSAALAVAAVCLVTLVVLLRHDRARHPERPRRMPPVPSGEP